MSQLEEATRKLESALERLDRATATKMGQTESQDVELRAALSDAKENNARLQTVATQASDRLDGAITRLRAILEG